MAPTAAPNLERRADIWPTETAPVINFRSEGRRFGSGRCLVPASHFYEFAGSKAPKSKWRFTKAGED